MRKKKGGGIMVVTTLNEIKEVIIDDALICSFDGSSGFLNTDTIKGYICLNRPLRELYLQSYTLKDEVHIFKYTCVHFMGDVQYITISITQDEDVIITEEEMNTNG